MQFFDHLTNQYLDGRFFKRSESGALVNLTTTVKTSLVLAINSLVTAVAALYTKPAGGIPVGDLAGTSGTLTVDAAGGTGAITLTDYGTNYLVLATIVSAPAGSLLRATRGDGSCTIAIVDATGTAVDCSSTNAVVDYLILKTPAA